MKIIIYEDDDSCALTWERTETLKKGVREVKIAFALSDLDPQQLALETKGKQVLVTARTRGNEKILKQYTDQEKLTFVSELLWPMPDLETGRQALATLRAQVAACTK